jgi:hypothetical protein
MIEHTVCESEHQQDNNSYGKSYSPRSAQIIGSRLNVAFQLFVHGCNLTYYLIEANKATKQM